MTFNNGVSFLALVLGFLAPHMTSQAQVTRYVAINGNDDGGASTCSNQGAPCRTIGHAIAGASARDVIQIAGGSYTESLTIDKSLALRGAGQDETFIQAHEEPGDADERVIAVDGEREVEIADLTIRHGHATGSQPDNLGGGLYGVGAALTLTNVTFDQNSATGTNAFGGAMYTASCSYTLTNVTFSDNAAGIGGGMYSVDDTSSSLSNVIFIGNEAANGGGMHNDNSSPMLTDVAFNGNVTFASGGGMFNRGSSPLLTNVTFSSNVSGSGGGMFNFVNSSAVLNNVLFSGNAATNSGGGMYNHTSSPTLTEVTFKQNEADQVGGGMFNNGSSPTLFNVTFVRNRLGNPSGSGAGMHNSNSSPTLTDVTFDRNEAGDRGGGMINNQNSAPTLTDVTFEGNSAGTDGGGMYNLANSSPTLIGVLFSGNSGAENGGGMYNVDGSSPTLTDVTFRDNEAFNGGGMYNDNSAPVLSATIFSGNSVASTGSGSATSGGAGMYNRQSSPFLTDVTFTNNAAGLSGNGGGMYNQEESSPKLINVRFTGNSAELNGGAMFNLFDSSPALDDVRMSGNVAGQFGGGLFNFASSPTLHDVVITGNKTDGSGGGVYNRTESSPILTNVTISGNMAGVEGGAMYNTANCSPTMTNVIISSNGASGSTTSTSASIFNDDSSVPSIAFSLIGNSGGSGGIWEQDLGDDLGGNIDGDPVFVQAVAPSLAPTSDGDYRLESISDAIDAGENEGVATLTDLDGRSRIVGGSVDLGAYEHRSADVSEAKAITRNNVGFEFGETGIEVQVIGAIAGDPPLIFVDYVDRPAENITFADTISLIPEPYRWVVTHAAGAFSVATLSLTGGSAGFSGVPQDVLDLYRRANVGAGDFSKLDTSVEDDRFSAVVTSFGEFILAREESAVSAENTVDVGVPNTYALKQNYPNPFNPTTTIGYQIPVASRVGLDVFDVLGRRVAVLVDEHRQAGYHTAEYDVGDLPSGLYLYRIRAGRFVATRKLTVAK